MVPLLPSWTDEATLQKTEIENHISKVIYCYCEILSQPESQGAGIPSYFKIHITRQIIRYPQTTAFYTLLIVHWQSSWLNLYFQINTNICHHFLLILDFPRKEMLLNYNKWCQLKQIAQNPLRRHLLQNLVWFVGISWNHVKIMSSETK